MDVTTSGDRCDGADGLRNVTRHLHGSVLLRPENYNNFFGRIRTGLVAFDVGSDLPAIRG